MFKKQVSVKFNELKCIMAAFYQFYYIMGCRNVFNKLFTLQHEKSVLSALQKCFTVGASLHFVAINPLISVFLLGFYMTNTKGRIVRDFVYYLLLNLPAAFSSN